MLRSITATVCFAQNTTELVIRTDTAQKGAIVAEVTADGPAAKAGISAYDIVTAVEGTAVRSPLQILEALARHKPGDTMKLTVARASDGSLTEVTITLGASPRNPSQPYMGLTFDLGYILLMPEDGMPPAQKEAPPGI